MPASFQLFYTTVQIYICNAKKYDKITCCFLQTLNTSKHIKTTTKPNIVAHFHSYSSTYLWNYNIISY
jgi:hypothetical protein